MPPASDHPDRTLTIALALAAEVPSVVEPLFREYGEWVARRLEQDEGIVFGEADLARHHGIADLAWLAAGRMDGFWEDDLDVWDTAAGVLLVREAGGFVTDFRGADRSFERREYVAGSAAIHSKLQKLVAGALR